MGNETPKWTRLKYSREALIEAVVKPVSMAGVMRELGVRLTGGAHAHLRRRIDREGIDTSHFTGSVHNKGKSSHNRLTPDKILVLRPPTVNRAKPHHLRRALIESGVRYECAFCEISSERHGQPITLHLDHISADYADCRMENLRFFCPNCHSQTPTYAGKGKRKGAVPPIAGTD